MPNNHSRRPSEHLEVVVVGSDVLYPSRVDSDIMWSRSPFCRVSNTANFRGAEPFVYADGVFEVDENGLVLAPQTVEHGEKRNFFGQLLPTLCLKLKAFGKHIGVVKCAPA